MCFKIHPDYVKVKIAERDILVYKRGNCSRDHFYSPFRPFQYNKGEVAPKVDLKVESVFGDIHQGYHSFYFHKCYIQYYNGMFLIPKGSRYFINIRHGEIVSNKIVYLGPYSRLFRQQCLQKYDEIKLNRLKKESMPEFEMPELKLDMPW